MLPYPASETSNFCPYRRRPTRHAAFVHGPRVVTEVAIDRLDLSWIEMIDRDHPGSQFIDLAQLGCFLGPSERSSRPRRQSSRCRGSGAPCRRRIALARVCARPARPQPPSRWSPRARRSGHWGRFDTKISRVMRSRKSPGCERQPHHLVANANRVPACNA